VTYSSQSVLTGFVHLLTNPAQATTYVACRGTRTPYPQKHQQTLGATWTVLWKTTSNLHKSGFPGFLAGKKPNRSHFDQFGESLD
jgi:hypothetical protein